MMAVLPSPRFQWFTALLAKNTTRYPRARFVALVGADTPMPDALRKIARGACEKAKRGQNMLHDRCKAQFYGSKQD